MKNNEVIIVDLLGNMEDKYHLIPSYSEKEASRLFNWIFLQEDPMCFVETNGKIESFKVLIELKKHNKLTKLQQKKFYLTSFQGWIIKKIQGVSVFILLLVVFYLTLKKRICLSFVSHCCPKLY